MSGHSFRSELSLWNTQCPLAGVREGLSGLGVFQNYFITWFACKGITSCEVQGSQNMQLCSFSDKSNFFLILNALPNLGAKSHFILSSQPLSCSKKEFWGRPELAFLTFTIQYLLNTSKFRSINILGIKPAGLFETNWLLWDSRVSIKIMSDH